MCDVAMFRTAGNFVEDDRCMNKEKKKKMMMMKKGMADL
jgi:hypothetical protein